MLDLDQVRQALLDDRLATTQQREAMSRDFANVVEAASDVATDDEHDPEGATIAYERARTAALVAQADEHLAAIELALSRLGNGSYADCECCGQPIAEERLSARPVAITCLNCASRNR
jgi:RNA polymerase-binding transcription factor DksA